MPRALGARCLPASPPRPTTTSRGTDDDRGIGQVAVHLLVVDRGVTLIALRLALGQSAVDATGQPRPAGGAADRIDISALAEKAAAASEGLRAEPG